MSEPTVADFFIPSFAASLLASTWASAIFWPTFQLAKRLRYKWLASLAGYIASLAVLVGTITSGVIAFVGYWAGIKKVDFSQPWEPKGAPEAMLDPAIWVVLAPIMAPLIILTPIFIKWKKMGQSIGVDWA